MKTDKKIIVVEKENVSKIDIDKKPLVAKELNQSASKIESDIQKNHSKNIFKIYEVE